MANKKIIQHEIFVSKDYTEAQRRRIGELAIELILERTANGLDENNKPFKNYSKEWAKEKGVGVSDVDLEYTGDMLSELEVVEVGTVGRVIIGYDGSEVDGQVEGNITGKRGKPPKGGTHKVVNARPFLGIGQDDKDIILGKVGQSPSIRDEAKAATLDSFMKNLINTQGSLPEKKE